MRISDWSSDVCSSDLFALVAEEGQAPGIRWRQKPVAMLCAGTGLLQPDIRLDAGILALPSEQQRAIGRRLTDWFDAQKQRHLRHLPAMGPQARDDAIAPPSRAVLATIADAVGVLTRN